MIHRDNHRDDSYLYPNGVIEPLGERIYRSIIRDLQERVKSLEKRLDNLAPTDEQLAKYPSLREAFEQFLIIKRLTLENET